jgi:hypothetical protein
MKRRAAVGGLVVAAVVGALAWRHFRAPPDRYPRVVDAILAEVDTDEDGELSTSEYERVALPDEPMRRYDVDRDGTISRRELENAFLHTSPTTVLRGRLNRTRKDEVVPLSR